MSGFLEVVWGRDPELYGELRFIRDGEIEQAFIPLADLSDVDDIVTAYQGVGYDAYYGVLPRVRRSGKAQDCVDVTRVLWADVDAKHFSGNLGLGKATALASLNGYRVPPSITVDSGGGYHAYWFLDHPVAYDLARPVMKHIALSVGGDSVQDRPRVLRLPGSMNFKREPATVARILTYQPGRCYRFGDLESLVPPPSDRPIVARARTPEDLKRLADWVAQQGEGNRNNGLFWAAAQAQDDGVPYEQAYSALVHASSLDPVEAGRTIDSAYRRQG